MNLELRQYLIEAVKNKQLIEAVFSAPISAKVKSVLIKSQLHYQLTRIVNRQAIHTNYSEEELLKVIEDLLPQSKEATFFTETCDLLVIKDRLIKKKPTKVKPLLQHNRTKNTVLKEGEPLPFLIELGLMKPTGALAPQKGDKFRQINKFLEIVQEIFPHFPAEGPLHILDFGCGKGYLTFALYHFLHNLHGREVLIQGLDLKEELMADCQALARRLGYEGLHFKVGSIENHTQNTPVAMVVALHACNTATDAALAKALAWDAEVILAAPCCQHELYNQVQNTSLEILLRHGILREKFAALATDAVRADLLEACGYTTKVVEFIDAEHTPKNLLIRAVKGNGLSQRKKAFERYQKCKSALHITPSLEEMVRTLGRWPDFRACE